MAMNSYQKHNKDIRSLILTVEKEYRTFLDAFGKKHRLASLGTIV